MPRIQVSTVLDHDPEEVWAYVRDLSSHVEWMQDAESISFRTEQRAGVGTTFDCRTRVGPLTTNDVMEVVEWEEGSVIGVRHSGLVTGEGRFTLEPAGPGRTEFRWTEELDLPWWMAPPVAARVLEWIWRRNLDALGERLRSLQAGEEQRHAD